MPESKTRYSVMVAEVTNPSLINLWPAEGNRLQLEMGSPEAGFRVILYLSQEVSTQISRLLWEMGFDREKIASRQ